MTLARLLAAALVVSSALAFAQTKSEPWKFIPSLPSDAAASKDPLSRIQVDQ